MLRLRLDLARPLVPQLTPAIEALRAGLPVACPTDTLYGLAADPRSDAAMERLFELKGRGAARAVALMAASLEQVERTVVLSQTARRLASEFWPGPLTLILPAAAALSAAVRNDAGRVGIRIPDHPVATALAEAFGHPLTATSANPSGQPPTTDPDEVASRLSAVAVLIDGGVSPGGPPSTVVEVEGEGLRLVRKGALPFDRVLRSLKSPS
jgi:L-threonylcarbamoyladenylate synthase